ncbi:MAG: PIN domain-containing protein, partial [Chloroflexota bacterium]
PSPSSGFQGLPLSRIGSFVQLLRCSSCPYIIGTLSLCLKSNIELGEKLLDEDSSNRFLDSRNRDALLTNILIACLERGKVDADAFIRANGLVEKYHLENPSLEFKAGIEAEIFLNNNDVEKALWAVIDGVKIKKTLSAKEYARLYILFVNIGNRIDLSLDSLDKVQNDTFVKLSNKDQWYSIENNNELDALPIAKANEKYSSLIDKKLGGLVVFENKYGSGKSEGEIERIYTIEKYVLWQVVQNFHKLAKDGDLEWAQMIEIPQKEDSIDPQNLLKYLKDLNSRTEPFFDLYCKNNFPLAILAVSEGGLIPAIGSIQNENRGFIHFSVGTIEELEKQKKLAKNVIDEKLQFYIDGTSALMLSEMGLLEKIHAHLPNLKVPQSVIVMFGEIANRFRYISGQTMGYARGKITLSVIEECKRELIQANIRASVKLFESNHQNVGIISSANKIDCLSETRVPDELCDACILAQKENLPVLTEDHLYLEFNELETKKKAPEYFSSWALIRVLYEEGHLSFDEYLDYFGYLSSYRFRFLSLNPDDIEKAVFGDREPRSVKPENIRKLNFPLTLSEEYGVPFQVAFRVVGIFLFKVIMDDAIALGDVEKIFIEIINSFPTTMGKKELGQMLLETCNKILERNMLIKFCRLEDKLKHQKIGCLLQATEFYNVEAKPLPSS